MAASVSNALLIFMGVTSLQLPVSEAAGVQDIKHAEDGGGAASRCPATTVSDEITLGGLSTRAKGDEPAP